MSNNTNSILSTYYRFLLNLIIFVFLVFNSTTIYSQSESYIVSGHVIDSLSKKPIANIHIIAIDKDIGMVSNNNGFFEMIVPSTPITLQFSFVGYNSKQKIITITSDTNIIVNLTPKTFELKEVAINSKKNTYNSQRSKYTVLDYNFIGDSLLILQKRRGLGGLPSLVLLNWNYDTILYKNDIPKGANRIFKDCLNSFHVLTKDSAYQIVLYHDYISLYEPYDIHWFNQTIEACLFKKDRNLFFEFSTYQGYGHEIIYIDEINKTRNIFTKYVDTESYSSLLEDISAISSYYFLHSVVNTSTNDSLTISHINNFNRENRYIRKFENQTIKNTIRLINDTIIYFNYYESKIQYFSNLTVPPIDIDYQNTKG